MRSFMKSAKFKVIVVILTVMFGFMVAALYSNQSSAFFGEIFHLVAEPFQKAASGISNSAAVFFDKRVDTAAAYEANRQLRSEIVDLKKKLVDYNTIKHEYEQLQRISGIRSQLDEAPVVPASVIARIYGDPFAAFSIDKGSIDDIAVNDPVITPEGLVGYVVECGLSTSKVMTLLDVKINVGVTNSVTRDVGNITGTPELAEKGLCRLDFLPRDSLTAKGDLIITSGSKLFPKNVIIGEVVDIYGSSGNNLEAIIRPSAEIINIKDVFVITDFLGQGEK